MKLFEKLTTFEDAQTQVAANLCPVTEVERVHITQALDRVLGEDIVARFFIPPFDRAGMDGYAVRFGDTTTTARNSPVRLRLAGKLFAGSANSLKLKPGECIQIATGAKMPSGADAVVMIENTSVKSSNVYIHEPVAYHENVGLKGEDITRGEPVLARECLLDAGKIGVLASQGLSRVKVFRRPRVAVMPTGEEIVSIGKRLRAGQLYDINSYTLASVIHQNGGLPVLMPISGDTLEGLNKTLTEALAQSDMIVTSGGSSVGEKDLLINILEERGKVKFHGINIKPGKPTTFAVVDSRPVMGMPGYPTSCLINAHLFLGPAVRRLARLPARYDIKIEATLMEDVWGGNGRRRFQPVRLEGNLAYPVLKQSGAITGTSQADGYIVVNEEQTRLVGGCQTEVTLF